MGGASSPVRQCTGGGIVDPASDSKHNEYVTIMTEGDAVDFGDLTVEEIT